MNNSAKAILSFALSCLFAQNTFNTCADIVTISYTATNGIAGGKSFSVPSNTLAQVIHCFNGNTCVFMTVTANGATGIYNFQNQNNSQNLPYIVGPASIGLSNTDSCATSMAYFTVQTTPLSTISNTNTQLSSIPSTAVVIPNDTNGPVTILLESSVDMVNWTPALPGTFGTTSTNRFFRVRAQR
jgi:hypothetical protein